MEILHDTKGLIMPDVYEINERDSQWAFQKLGLNEGETPSGYLLEEITDTHQVALCYASFILYLFNLTNDGKDNNLRRVAKLSWHLLIRTSCEKHGLPTFQQIYISIVN